MDGVELDDAKLRYIEIHGKSAKYLYVDGITGVYDFQLC